MPSQTEIENAVTAVLDRRAHETQAAQRELERATAIRAQREIAEAETATRAQREARQKQIALLEVEQRNCHDRCLVLEQQCRELPDRLVAERGRLSAMLYQLNELWKGL
ncbi:MAG: hypothetical protein WBQ46_08055 [Terriglobales bacterium]